MLQPEQLRQVAQGYAVDITELHDFLASAGISTGTADALAATAARLGSDRSFHRDMLLHVSVILDRHDRQTSYPDLLGVVALSAAGPAFAATAQAGDAHDLLRFLMDARHTLQNGATHTEGATSVLSAEAQFPSEARLPGSSSAPSFPVSVAAREPRPEVTWTASSIRKGLKRAAWMVAAACIVAASLVLTRLYNRSHPASVFVIAAIEQRKLNGARQDAAPPVRRGAEASRLPLQPALTATNHHEAVAHASALPARPARAIETHPLAASPLTILTPEHVPVHAATSSKPDSIAASATAPANTFRADIKRALSGLPAAVPSSVLSLRLGSRTLPPEFATEEGSYNAKYPRLLRRRPLLPLAAENNEAMESTALSNPVIQPDGFPGASNLRYATTVRPVSLGVMAANVLYSPAPAYPVAAVSAHVQGEVKIQAEVGRDGNVASARVVSGPPLLRDAAVDAVQRWRYRPYLSAGKPVAMSATAVVDFQLQ